MHCLCPASGLVGMVVLLLLGMHPLPSLALAPFNVTELDQAYRNPRVMRRVLRELDIAFFRSLGPNGAEEVAVAADRNPWHRAFRQSLGTPPRPMAVFLHLGLCSSWSRAHAERVLLAVQFSGLLRHAELHVNVVGNQSFLPVLPKSAVVTFRGALQENEFVTLRDLLQYSREHPDALVLYMHNKGGFNSPPTEHHWSDVMAWMNAWMFRWCVILLAHYHTVGTYLMRDLNRLHRTDHFYAGNFWWARASYIAAIDPTHVLQPRNRFDSELWIGAPVHREGQLNPALGRYACLLQPSSFSHFEGSRYLIPEVYHGMAAAVWEHRPGRKPPPSPPRCVVNCWQKQCGGGRDIYVHVWKHWTLSPA
eukprot:RCo036198